MNDICLVVADYKDGKIAVQAVAPEAAQELYENCCKTADRSAIRLMLVTITTDENGVAVSTVKSKNLPQVKKSEQK